MNHRRIFAILLILTTIIGSLSSCKEKIEPVKMKIIPSQQPTESSPNTLQEGLELEGVQTYEAQQGSEAASFGPFAASESTVTPASIPVTTLSPVPPSSLAPVSQPEDNMHFLVQQESAEVQQLFWTIYHCAENFEEHVVFSEAISRKLLEKVCFLFNTDCPELFYFSHISQYYYVEPYPDVITEIDLSYYMTPEEAKSASEKIESIIGSWSSVTSGMNDYDKELYVHDAVINGCQYVLDEAHGGTIYGALVLGKARCQGYANTMTYVMRRMGIPCIYLYGEATNELGTESHAWNLVLIDGVWTLVDMTWDDPLGEVDQLLYSYFNVNDAILSESHVLSSDYGDYVLPESSSLQVNYSVKNKTFVFAGESGSTALQKRLETAYLNHASSLQIQFETLDQYNDAINSIQTVAQAAADATGIYPYNLQQISVQGGHYLELTSIDYRE